MYIRKFLRRGYKIGMQIPVLPLLGVCLCYNLFSSNQLIVEVVYLNDYLVRCSCSLIKTSPELYNAGNFKLDCFPFKP